MTWALLAVYCGLILAASLAGGAIPLLVRLQHRQMQIAVSAVAGVMLGVGLLHLLPHALLEAPERLDFVFWCVLLGFLAMFFIERFFCYHHHDVPGNAAEGECCHAASRRLGEEQAPSHNLTWSGAAIGLSLHTVLNGVALAAAVESESRGGHVGALVGLGTFLVIFLHKPLDAMTISALMTVGGWSVPARHLVNAMFAMMVPVGVVLFQLGLGHVGEGTALLAAALAFSAGTFLCIATSDLLPELQFHRHDRLALSAALLLGLAVAWGIGLIETRGLGHHQHGHSAGEPCEHQHRH